MGALSDAIRRGLAAARPAVGDVTIGALYHSTDTGVTERNSGSTWEDFSDGGNSYWDFELVKPSDQDVVNSNTLVDDTFLQLPVTAGDAWQIELLITYSGTGTAQDFKWDVAVSAGTMSGSGHYTGISTTETGLNDFLVLNEVTSSADVSMGTRATHGLRTFKATINCVFSATGTFTFRFCEVGTGAGTESRCKAGSRLNAKKLIP